MMIRIIPRKKIFHPRPYYYSSSDPTEYSYLTNVISKKSEFCCIGLAKYIEDRDDFVFSCGSIYLRHQICYYCPYCGTKINTELVDTEEEERYQREEVEREKRYQEYLKNLPPTPKKVVRKRKKQAISDYNKIFERFEIKK